MHGARYKMEVIQAAGGTLNHVQAFWGPGPVWLHGSRTCEALIPHIGLPGPLPVLGKRACPELMASFLARPLIRPLGSGGEGR